MKHILFIFLFIPYTFWGQEIEKATQVPHIDVIGSAEKEIVPNIITIKIVLQETNDKNKVAISDQEKMMMEKFTINGFDLKNLVIRNANASLLKLSKRTNDVINKKEYLMKVSTTQEAYKIFNILDEIDVKEASIYETSHTDIQVHKKEVQQLALKAAKQKATDLLTSINEQIGNPLIIREVNSNETNNQRMIYANVSYPEYKKEAQTDTEYLEVKPIKLRYEMFA